MSYIPTLSQTRALMGDPAPNWRWGVVLPTDIVGFSATTYAFSQGSSSFSSGGMGNSGQRFLSTPSVPFGRVQNINLPGFTLDTDNRFSAAQMVHYPRHLNVDDIQINFYEDKNYNTMNYLQCWLRMIVDGAHNFNVANYYKKDIYFFAFDEVDANSPRLIGRCRKCFPTNPGVGLQYDTSSSNIVTIPCTFSVKDIEVSFNPATK